jgi:3D (Asp-Asp-Asp) domain-containing protein
MKILIALLLTIVCYQSLIIVDERTKEREVEIVTRIVEKPIISREAREIKRFSLIPLGEYEVTAYTAGFESTGKNIGDKGYGITASGTTVQPNHTIASDWDMLPVGTQVMFEGDNNIYTVEDKGGAIKGKRIDIYMEGKADAIQFGRQLLHVYLVEYDER